MDAIRNGAINSSDCYIILSTGKRDMTPDELAEYKKDNPKGRKTTIECWPGQSALNYFEDCRREKRLGRSLENESNARPLSWGKLVEPCIFDQLDTDYIYCSDKTLQNPLIKHHTGTPDGRRGDQATVETKAPLTLKSFCQLVDPLYDGLTGMDAMNAIRNGYTDKNGIFHEEHKDGEKFYWQCLSNSILQKTSECELIVFMPFESQLQDIIDLANSKDGFEISKYYWVANASEGELPSIPDGGFYNNINKIVFTPPQEDKNHLVTILKKAEKYL